MKYMLDTNICIYIINNKPAHVTARFRQFTPGDIGLSAITAAELAFGVEKSGSSRNHNALEKFMAPLEILALDETVIWHYARICTQLEQAGQAIGALDTLIAAHAITHNLTLVSNNTREFARVPGLQLENWA